MRALLESKTVDVGVLSARRLVPSVLVVGLVLSGCRGCANDHPYVPPATTAKESAADAAAPLAQETSDAGNLVEPALVAPPGSTTWQTSGLTLEAGGREIVVALVGDFDGDGKKDALAIVRPERRAGASTGELVFFRGGAPPAAAIATGPALGMMPTCVPTARLEKIGPRSAFAEIGSSCPRGAGERAIVVVRLGPPMPVVAFDAIVTDPREAPKLTVDVDAADRDRDGLDDVVLRVALEGTPRVGARLAFFDRPAGPSRDPEEPEASLRVLAGQASARAAKPKEAASVPPLVQQIRALYRAMCLEGGAARVTKIHGGSAASCGSSKALEDAGLAEVRAWAAEGDALRALTAAEQAQLSPATKTAAKTTELARLVGEAAPVAPAKNVRLLTMPVDAPRDGQPEWGPLAFEPSGKLLVRNRKAVVRVDPESGESEPTDLPAWRDDVVSPDGASRWIEAYHACEGVAFRATFAPTGAGEMQEVVLPIAPRLGRSCTGGRGEIAPATPIAWSTQGLEALVAGQLVLVKPDAASTLAGFTDMAPPPGSPRAQGGKAFALPTPNGILVARAAVTRPGGGHWSMVRSSDLEPYADVKRCTPSDDGTRVACVRRRGVALVTLP